jgi:hypothetical protein
VRLAAVAPAVKVAGIAPNVEAILHPLFTVAPSPAPALGTGTVCVRLCPRSTPVAESEFQAIAIRVFAVNEGAALRVTVLVPVVVIEIAALLSQINVVG